MAEKSKISGWYYDLQQENPMTCVTLHPNSMQNDSGDWVPIPSGKTDPDDESIGDNKYQLEPIARAIVSEDFNVTIANTWSDFGGDALGQMWGTVKTLAPYADVAESALQTALQSYDNMDATQKAKVENSMFARALHGTLEHLGRNPGAITDYLNRALVVQGTRFSYYNGTGVSFGNLVMKFTLFPKWVGDEFWTVNKQVNKIYPYLVGQFVKETSLPANLQDYIGWQKPPAGFKANLKDVDVVQFGTLKLKYGPYYSINNLVCENATFNFSKQMVKKPIIWKEPTIGRIGDNGDVIYTNSSGKVVFEGAESEPDSVISPLYCDVTIQLRPATKFSDVSLKKFVLGINSLNTIKETNATLEKSLKTEIEELTNIYK